MLARGAIKKDIDKPILGCLVTVKGEQRYYCLRKYLVMLITRVLSPIHSLCKVQKTLNLSNILRQLY